MRPNKKSSDNNKNDDKEPSRLGKVISFMIVTLLCSILAEIIFITFVYPELGAKSAINVYLLEQSWIEKDYDRGISVLGGISPYQILNLSSEWLNKTILTIIIPKLGEQNFGMQNGNYFSLFDDYIIATGVVICITIYRAVILLLSLPVYGLAFFIGFTYGVTRRELRKFNVGRETSRVHYLAKSLILPSLYVPWFVYLSIPYAVPAAVVVVPTALFIVVAVRYTAEYFEKVF
ncbi:hypothetical protein A1QO_06285 [Vibrio genomosp. F10 str. ZF-129]|uniref:Integrating conjugative element membrane protein n=1 Tax=Vibrio genomosp. F10 str. ZF-129 TaxID=1187848 RepID=A0A1E5BG50_9VIBR|nr:DUF4400 domain-containing protein [Vibrio genomosp. F10]OEE34990.1 hypothetical protein A1QO_06285 [Vibrio genomosp. F10 str. ZF-129]